MLGEGYDAAIVIELLILIGVIFLILLLLVALGPPERVIETVTPIVPNDRESASRELIQKQDWRESHSIQLERLKAYVASVGSETLFPEDDRRELEVVGESKRNYDGGRRQDIIPSLTVGDMVLLLREPRNPWDRDAVAVCTTNFQQIGYLNRFDAKEIAELMDSGKILVASVKYIGGGTPDKPSYGVWLFVDVAMLQRNAQP